MATRFVPTHVRSAITVVETDHERTTTERDAFASFLHRISDLDISSIDLQPNHAHQASTQTLATPETPEHAESQLERVRNAYRDTVMSVPHYDEDYGDSLPESLAEEFGPEIATAILTSDQLTPHLRNLLIDATHHARESRHALLQGLENEHSALEAADENLTRLSADLDDVLSTQSFHAWSGKDLTNARDCLHDREAECDQLAADRQATLREQRIPGTHHIDHEFTEYLYESLPVTYPVLTDITSLVGTLRTAQHSVERALNARNSETPNP
jgi:hypothetical protein